MIRFQSKIENLVVELCPSGVDFKTLGEVCDFKYGKGNTIPKVGGEYPVYGCNGIVGAHYEFNNEDSPIIGHIGTAGIVVWGKGKHFVTYNGTICKPKDKTLLSKYLYYNLLILNLPNLTKGSQPFLSYDTIKALKIPFPPIAVQEEIVKILNSFTELEAELEAELEVRKKQYKHYRDNLLDIKNVEYKALGEMGEFIRGNGLQKKDFTEIGVGCIHYGQIYTYYGTFTDKTKSFISPELAKKLKKVQKGDVIITNTSENLEDVGKAVVWCGEDEIVTGGHATIFKPEKVTGKYFASILVDNKKELPNKKAIKEKTSVGIDLGIKTFLVSSDGKEFDNPKFLKKSLSRLKYVQRKYSKKKGKRTKYRLQRIHEIIANQRKDFLHKTSIELINNHDTICIEDLNIKGMVKNSKLSQSITDVSWGEFVRQLEYKAEWYGKNIIRIGRFEPSSKTCSCCGNINKELTLIATLFKRKAR